MCVWVVCLFSYDLLASLSLDSKCVLIFVAHKLAPLHFALVKLALKRVSILPGERAILAMSLVCLPPTMILSLLLWPRIRSLSLPLILLESACISGS